MAKRKSKEETQPDAEVAPVTHTDTNVATDDQTKQLPANGHAAKIKTDHGVPNGFVNVFRDSRTGIAVNKSLDRTIVAIQFPEDRRADPEEKKEMGENGIGFRRDTRQYERHVNRYLDMLPEAERAQAGEGRGANIYDAERIAKNFVIGRTEGRSM